MENKDLKDSGGSRSVGAVVIVLCLVLAAMMAIWHFRNRAWIGPTFGAEVTFITSPDTVPSGVAARFVVRVVQDNKSIPLPGRVMDVQVTPNDQAEILSVSGVSGRNHAISGSPAKGRTDSAGTLDIMVRASKPGKYTLVALDSTSAKEGTVNFHVAAPGPERPGDR